MKRLIAIVMKTMFILCACKAKWRNRDKKKKSTENLNLLLARKLLFSTYCSNEKEIKNCIKPEREHKHKRKTCSQMENTQFTRTCKRQKPEGSMNSENFKTFAIIVVCVRTVYVVMLEHIFFFVLHFDDYIKLVFDPFVLPL